MQLDFPLIPVQLTRSRHDGETRWNLHWYTNRGAGLAERRTTVGSHFFSDHLAEARGAKDPDTAKVIDGRIYHDLVVKDGDEVVHRVTAEQVHAAEELSELREELLHQQRAAEEKIRRQPETTLESALCAND